MQKNVNNKVNNRNIFLVTILFALFIMFLLNCLTPLLADDYEYFFKTTNFSTILLDEYHQYLSWTGRSIVHIIARIFLLMPKWVFNIANSLAYVGVSYLIYKLSLSNGEKYKTVRFLLIQFLIWLFVPAFGQVFLWETGSANYLWGSLIILSYLFFFHKATINNWIPKRPTSLVPLVFIMGVLAGWCNENTSGGALLLAIFYIGVYMISNKQKVPLWMIGGIIGNFIGLVIMILAPGNKIRATYFARSTWSIHKKLSIGLVTVFNEIKEHLFLLFCLLLVLYILNLYNKKMETKFYLSVAYAVFGIVTLLALSLSPAGLNWGRSYYGGVIFMIIAISLIWPDRISNLKSDNSNIFYTIIYGLLALSFMMNFIMGSADICKSYIKINSQYNYLTVQREKGNLNPVFPTMSFPDITKYTAYSKELTQVNSNIKHNHPVAKYYKLNTIRSVSENDWQQVYKNGNPTLMGCYSFDDYLKLLTKGNYTILISGHGSHSYLNSEQKKLLNQLGIQKMPSSSGNWVSIALLDKGNKKASIAKSFTKMNGKLSKMNYELKSSLTNYDDQIFSTIQINGRQYSKNKAGLNFVTIDRYSNRVVDSVNFDITNKNIIGNR